MKKLFSILTIAFTLQASAQIATKSIGVDSVTGLRQNVNVWQLLINAQTKEVFVMYSISTIAPTGATVATSEMRSYRRFNEPARLDSAGTVIVPAKMKYDQLKASVVGQMIQGMINQDLSVYPKLDQ